MTHAHDANNKDVNKCSRDSDTMEPMVRVCVTERMLG